MHELSLMADLFRKIDAIALDQQARRVTSVRVRLGALSHISADHLREHFEQASRGTIAEGARLEVVELTELADPNAQDIVLESLEAEFPDG